jgi:hypothetical protein
MKRKKLLACELLASEWQESWYRPDGMPTRKAIYSDDTTPIWIDGTPTSETCRQADRLFDRFVKTAPAYGGYKEFDNRQFCHRLLHAGKRAAYYNGCIVYSREIHRNKQRELQICGDNDPPSPGPARPFVFSTDLQVIECCVQSGLFHEERSPPGSPKMSRLIPTFALSHCVEIDPWAFEPHENKQFVFLRDRDTKQEIDFDKNHPVAAKYQKRLAKINASNAKFEIYYQPFSPFDQCFEAKRQLRPVQYARFSDDFDQHGRIYTGKYGHQALRKLERHTIEFQMEPHCLERSVELDYGGLHPRLAYHLAGIDYQEDPYELWPNTTLPMRLMAKVCINAALNAKSPKGAIDSCNEAMSSWTKDKDSRGKRKRKQGKALADAIQLFDAAQQTGLKFKDVHALAMKNHQRIADQFCSDAGMRLMRLDSELALRIMYHFAKQNIPCLGVHDSFIVPVSAKTELQRVMRTFYRQKTGFNPVVK